MNGPFNFHYDEALRRLGPVRAWNEMTPAEVPPLNVSSVDVGPQKA